MRIFITVSGSIVYTLMMEATGHQRMTAGMPSAVPTSTQQPHTCNCPPQAEPPVEPPPRKCLNVSEKISILRRLFAAKWVI